MNTDRHYKIFYFFTKITGPATIAPVVAPLEYGFLVLQVYYVHPYEE